jgi:hypothetical protein
MTVWRQKENVYMKPAAKLQRGRAALFVQIGPSEPSRALFPLVNRCLEMNIVPHLDHS